MLQIIYLLRQICFPLWNKLWLYQVCLHRGCVFITYEVVTLNQALTIDTSAILQEKHKSYIYLTHATNREQESLASGTFSFHACVFLCLSVSRKIDLHLHLFLKSNLQMRKYYTTTANECASVVLICWESTC